MSLSYFILQFNILFQSSQEVLFYGVKVKTVLGREKSNDKDEDVISALPFFSKFFLCK